MTLACSTPARLAAALLALTAGAAHADLPPLLLDGFDNPSPPLSATAIGTGLQFASRSIGTFAGIPGQVRDASFTMSYDLNGQGIGVSLGGGDAHIQASPGALGEYLFSYGAFSSPGGPFMGLDLRAYNDLQVSFSAVDKGLNLVAVLYTAAPRLLPDGTPLYYLETGINTAPASPGAPLTADLLLDARDPVNGPESAYFNFAQVDGLFFVIDRSGFSAGNRYTLDSLQFAALPVPEPAPGALLLAGLGCVALLMRRRA